MPREQITHNKIVHPDPITPDDSPADGVPTAAVSREIPRRNIHVNWDRSGWVQINIDVSVAELREMLAAAIEQAESAKRATSWGEYDIEHHPFRVVSDVLDRREVNDTIRVLRRARDTAYGRDE